MYSTPPGRAGLKRLPLCARQCTQASTPPGLTVAPGSSRPQTECFIKAYRLPSAHMCSPCSTGRRKQWIIYFTLKGRGLPFLLHSHGLDTHGLYRAYVPHYTYFLFPVCTSYTPVQRKSSGSTMVQRSHVMSRVGYRLNLINSDSFRFPV